MQSLKKSVLRGSAWTMASVGTTQFMRLGKSLILTRLLFPEAYGVMAIVWAVLYALNMLSDVGISSGIIRSARGDDPHFLNTAWTMKVVRGAALCFIAIALAYPLSLFYNQPQLAWLIPVAGFTTFIEGFSSTNIYSCQRKMIYGRLALLDFSNELIGLLVTMIWAYFYPSVWALLGGAIATRCAQVYGSHILLPGIRNRFLWDNSAFKELLHFGKWIFFSSAIYLIYSQGDRMLLGKYLDVALLGVYSIAIMLSETVSGVLHKLNDAVIFPALSRVVNQSKDRLREVFYRTRLGSDALFVMPIGILLMTGDHLVKLLYDTRYQEAGWMLQVLCVRLLTVAMLVNGASCLFALGHSRYSVIQNICRATWVLIGIPVGWHYYGIEGVVWAVTLTELPVIFVVWGALAKLKLLSLIHEARSVLFAAIGMLLGYGLVYLLP